MQKLESRAENFLQELSKINCNEEKIRSGLKGFFRFFPFSRLSLFSYSPINYVSEGLLYLDSEGNMHPLEKIREDVREIPVVYKAIRNKRAEYVTEEKGILFPVKNFEQEDKCTVLIVPLWKGPIVLGCVLIDRYNGEEPLNEALIHSVETYFRVGVDVIAASRMGDTRTQLSKREIEVLEMLSHGWSTKEMAMIMNLSEFTARDYISSAMRKLGVKHRAQAVAEALRMGLIS
ncbi:hypothetical protein DCC39_11275 [Pueribacillus theae]|uniref:HTH luxR-type domain-containing protein n=1 Tax=Pueribacillus theae TaxID=2171751 RepID=A0A2U1JYV2_9BACI|nr:LuxR C-terminal-related transcriptional regulator [Pueribacillus theae]PWA10406.1 hypothetical protein DCC39_11275 [Pueribacillus theae]